MERDLVLEEGRYKQVHSEQKDWQKVQLEEFYILDRSGRAVCCKTTRLFVTVWIQY
jgi:hypothetical protein